MTSLPRLMADISGTQARFALQAGLDGALSNVQVTNDFMALALPHIEPQHLVRPGGTEHVSFAQCLSQETWPDHCLSPAKIIAQALQH